jgi:hypothetical protein
VVGVKGVQGATGTNLPQAWNRTSVTNGSVISYGQTLSGEPPIVTPIGVPGNVAGANNWNASGFDVAVAAGYGTVLIHWYAQ